MFKLYNILNTQFLGLLSPGQIAVGPARTRWGRCPMVGPKLNQGLGETMTVCKW
jgi:hypothetical protein